LVSSGGSNTLDAMGALARRTAARRVRHRPLAAYLHAKSWVVFIVGVAATACTAPSESAGPVVEAGIASHYADSLAGRPTASGEPYDPDQATCAHRTMALGTILEVHATRTDRRARCRVNDRGPFAKDRILDVSRTIAEQLGMDGIAKVELRVVSTPD
jgi:rare lipoprotein A